MKSMPLLILAGAALLLFLTLGKKGQAAAAKDQAAEELTARKLLEAEWEAEGIPFVPFSTIPFYQLSEPEQEALIAALDDRGPYFAKPVWMKSPFRPGGLYSSTVYPVWSQADVDYNLSMGWTLASAPSMEEWLARGGEPSLLGL
jgi:hypothetical protein